MKLEKKSGDERYLFSGKGRRDLDNPESTIRARTVRQKRPALVISPAAYNLKVGLALLCPITNRKKGYPFEVEIPEELPISGVVLVDHIKSADWKARNAEFICKLDSKITMEVLNKLNILISI